jgi:hypothetical protein
MPSITESSLPLAYQARLNTTYDGYRAALFDSSSDYHNFTTALRQAGLSFLTKIIKQKRKRGIARRFVVMVVESANAA